MPPSEPILMILPSPTLKARRCGALHAHQKRPARIGLEDRIPLVYGERVQRSGCKDGGIVHDEIEPPERAHGRGHGGAHRGLGAHIALDGQRAAAQVLDFARCLAASARELRKVIATSAPACARASAMPGHAPRAAGDECRFAEEGLVGHGSCCLFFGCAGWAAHPRRGWLVLRRGRGRIGRLAESLPPSLASGCFL